MIQKIHVVCLRKSAADAINRARECRICGVERRFPDLAIARVGLIGIGRKNSKAHHVELGQDIRRLEVSLKRQVDCAW